MLPRHRLQSRPHRLPCRQHPHCITLILLLPGLSVSHLTNSLCCLTISLSTYLANSPCQDPLHCAVDNTQYCEGNWWHKGLKPIIGMSFFLSNVHPEVLLVVNGLFVVWCPTQPLWQVHTTPALFIIPTAHIILQLHQVKHQLNLNSLRGWYRIVSSELFLLICKFASCLIVFEIM